MLGSNELTSRLEDKSYQIKSQEKSSAGRYTHFFNELDRIKASRKPKSLSKQLNRMRIESDRAAHSDNEGSPYLDSNAQTMGDFQYAENLKLFCGENVAWFEGVTSHDFYVKQLSCRKQWCPECGGKDGTIHKSRMHSVFSRIDPDKYNLQQFIFTVPENLRGSFQSKKALNEMFKMSRRVIERFFGCVEKDKFGHVKRYRMEHGCISYLHVFGDEEPGVFKPHMNVHIVRDKMALLKVPDDVLIQIKEAWLNELIRFTGNQFDVVNVYASFRIGAIKVSHALKYMLKPWSADHYEKIEDESLKSLLVLDLNGFQYFRYWGALANCSYKDEMDLTEIQRDVESKVNEILRFRFVSPFDLFAWSMRLEKIDDGLYRVKDGKKHEWKESEGEKTPGNG